MRKPAQRRCLEDKRRPSFWDHLVIGGASLGIFLLVLALGVRAGSMVELILILIATFAVVTINLLFAYSTWDAPRAQEKEPGQNSQEQKK